jgi:hypothetical protein
MVFRIVCKHAIRESKTQLLMHIAGTGGTGKSYVIEVIIFVFEQIGWKDHLVASAPTGCAAALIQGNTIHSLTVTDQHEISLISSYFS